MVDVPKGGVQEFTILACNWVGAVLFITRCERFKCQKKRWGGGVIPSEGQISQFKALYGYKRQYSVGKTTLLTLPHLD